MKIVLGILLWLLGFGMLVTAVIYQCSLSIQLYGAVFEHVIIPHWSLALLTGFIPIIIGQVMLVGVD